MADAGGHAGDGEGHSAAAPAIKSTIARGISEFLRGETAADAHGQAQSAHRSEDSDEGDLFLNDEGDP